MIGSGIASIGVFGFLSVVLISTNSLFLTCLTAIPAFILVTLLFISESQTIQLMRKTIQETERKNSLLSMGVHKSEL